MPQSRYLQHFCASTFFWTQSILDTAFRMADSERFFFQEVGGSLKKKTGLRNSRLYWAAGATYVVCMPDL